MTEIVLLNVQLEPKFKHVYILNSKAVQYIKNYFTTVLSCMKIFVNIFAVSLHQYRLFNFF